MELPKTHLDADADRRIRGKIEPEGESIHLDADADRRVRGKIEPEGERSRLTWMLTLTGVFDIRSNQKGKGVAEAFVRRMIRSCSRVVDRSVSASLGCS